MNSFHRPSSLKAAASCRGLAQTVSSHFRNKEKQTTSLERSASSNGPWSAAHWTCAHCRFVHAAAKYDNHRSKGAVHNQKANSAATQNIMRKSEHRFAPDLVQNNHDRDIQFTIANLPKRKQRFLASIVDRLADPGRGRLKKSLSRHLLNGQPRRGARRSSYSKHKRRLSMNVTNRKLSRKPPEALQQSNDIPVHQASQNARHITTEDFLEASMLQAFREIRQQRQDTNTRPPIDAEFDERQKIRVRSQNSGETKAGTMQSYGISRADIGHDSRNSMYLSYLFGKMKKAAQQLATHLSSTLDSGRREPEGKTIPFVPMSKNLSYRGLVQAYTNRTDIQSISQLDSALRPMEGKILALNGHSLSEMYHLIFYLRIKDAEELFENIKEDRQVDIAVVHHLLSLGPSKRAPETALCQYALQYIIDTKAKKIRWSLLRRLLRRIQYNVPHMITDLSQYFCQNTRLVSETSNEKELFNWLIIDGIGVRKVMEASSTWNLSIAEPILTSARLANNHMRAHQIPLDDASKRVLCHLEDLFQIDLNSGLELRSADDPLSGPTETAELSRYSTAGHENVSEKAFNDLQDFLDTLYRKRRASGKMNQDTWVQMLSQASRDGLLDIDIFERLFALLRAEGVTVDSRLLGLQLDMYQDDLNRTLHSLRTGSQSFDITLDAKLLSKFVRSLSRNGAIKDILDSFQGENFKMLPDSSIPYSVWSDTRLWNSAILATGHRAMSKCWSLLALMNSRGVGFDNDTFGHMADLAFRASSPSDAYEFVSTGNSENPAQVLHRLVQQSTLDLDNSTGARICRAYGRWKLVDAFRELCEKLILSSNDTRSILLGKFYQHYMTDIQLELTKEQEPDQRLNRALRQFAEMEQSNLKAILERDSSLTDAEYTRKILGLDRIFQLIMKGL